jgi:hypothetical protein
LSEKLKTQGGRRFASFADIPRDAIVTVELTPDPKMYVPWDATGMALTVLGKSSATETLMDWLRARMADLNREKVALEDVTIVNHGQRTIVRVLGKDRYEFKIKCTMGVL